ncbi:MAG: hypothetical protein PHI97_33340 [Desulfobulbus sp.]|nr:hypothetical protein [Desulfobulbus sp.]
MNGQLPGRDFNPHDIRLLLRTDRVNNTSLHFLFRAKKEADIEDERIFQTFGFRSKKAARMVCKDLESLRNNLAHAQDIVTHDLPQAARTAPRIVSVHRNQTGGARLPSLRQTAEARSVDLFRRPLFGNALSGTMPQRLPPLQENRHATHPEEH